MSETFVQETIDQLRKNGFDVFFHANSEEAAREILKQIPAHTSIGRAGSATCTTLDLYNKLRERGHQIYDSEIAGLTPEEKLHIRRQSLSADLLLTGTNAITQAGHLVNIDGVGNRVAAQVFGPRQVVIVAGTNKICPDLPAALKRIKAKACPPNARRLGLKTPCAFDHPCPPPDGCRSEHRMCNATVIIERKPRATPIRIHLIEGELGY